MDIHAYLRSATPNSLHLHTSFSPPFVILIFQVAEASRRLIQLQQLLGNQEDVDVVWMLVREPG